jgi:hypothetical protein
MAHEAQNAAKEAEVLAAARQYHAAHVSSKHVNLVTCVALLVIIKNLIFLYKVVCVINTKTTIIEFQL